jgi:hypothetical protein
MTDLTIMGYFHDWLKEQPEWTVRAPGSSVDEKRLAAAFYWGFRKAAANYEMRIKENGEKDLGSSPASQP